MLSRLHNLVASALLGAFGLADATAAPQVLLTTCTSPAACADGAAKTPAESANPLEADDPFIGEFASEEMLVIVRLSVDGFVGEIRRGGKTFPMKATAAEGKLSGSFTHGETAYKFVASLDGAMLKLTTGTKTYALKRKGVEGDASKPPANPTAPATPTTPTTPTPTPTPQPTSPGVKPAPELTVPRLPGTTPGTTPDAGNAVKPVLSGPLAQHLGYAQMTPQNLRDLAWARFPIGAHVIFEEMMETTNSLPATSKRKLVFMGMAHGRLSLRNFDWEGEAFDTAGQPVMQADGEPVRIGDLGLTKGESVMEEMTVQGVVLRCQKTRFSGEITSNGVTTKVVADVWRNSEVDVPPLLIDLPDKKMLVDPDMVRVKMTCELRGITGVVDFRLDSISHETKLSNQTIKYCVVKVGSTFDRSDGKIENAAEYWLSGQIPGGIVKTVQHERIGKHERTRTATATAFSHVANR